MLTRSYVNFASRSFSFIVIKKQFLPPRPGSRSGEDSLASSTQSLVTDQEPQIIGNIENIRYSLINNFKGSSTFVSDQHRGQTCVHVRALTILTRIVLARKII